GDGLVEVGVYGVEVGLQGVDQGDVEAVLPDAGRAVFADAVFMPGAVGGKDEIVGAQRHLVAVDAGIGAAASHDEAQGAGRMVVGRGQFAGVRGLQARIKPADRGGHVLPAGIVQVHDPSAGLFGRHQVDGAQHVVAQV